MSKLYQDIIDKYGAPLASSTFSQGEESILQNLLPDQVAEFCSKMGRSVLRGGLLQTCHPNDLNGVLAVIFGADKDFSHNNCFAFAYSAFGVVFFWMKEFGYGNLSIYEGRIVQKNLAKGQPAGPMAVNAVSVPFWLSDGGLDFEDENGRPLFKRASKRLGPLKIGECYGFVPALALGGSPELSHLKRLSASEHFAIVAQTMEYNLIDVQGYGQSVEVRPIGPR